MTEERRGTYRQFRLFAQPIFAVPATPRRLRLAGIARYQPITRKRAAYRRLMRLLMHLGLDRVVGRTVTSPVDRANGFDFHAWMERTRADLDEPRATCVVFWPPQRDRGRIYVHVFGSEFRPIGFAKISFDESNDVRLDREERMLRDLAGGGLRTFRVPRVLSSGRTGTDGHASLVMEPIPESARPLPRVEGAYPARCVAELAAETRRLSAAEIRRTSWWAEYESLLGDEHAAFAADLSERLVDGGSVCRTHGDFGTTNIVRDGDSLWIFDWEESHQEGPVLTDEISFYLGVNRPRSSTDPGSLIARFRERFLGDGSPIRRVDVMLALAFRYTVNARPAGLLISNWDQL
jgi:hypothetical protein